MQENKDTCQHSHCCELPTVPERVFVDDIDSGREALIRYNEKKWLNETVLHYYFFKSPANWSGSTGQEQAVRDAFQTWKDLSLGLEFVEVDQPETAEIRIAFEAGISWSYIGRDNLKITDSMKKTMNFGWDLTTTYGKDTALHEIGHVLGFPHEHQNPKSGIKWNEQAVIQNFSQAPNNWTEEKIRWNILRKIPAQNLEGTDWDPNSIMHYRFASGLITEPVKYQSQALIPTAGLSQSDIDEVQKFYPAVNITEEMTNLTPFQSHQIRIEAGEQLNFKVETAFDREYTIQTFGPIDTVMVLFEEIDGVPRLVVGDDDSGTDSNAKLSARLFRGRKYILRVRLFYAERSGNGALMMW